MRLTTDTSAKRIAFLSAILSPLVDSIDRYLRRRFHVIEFSRSPNCLFRLQIIENDEEFQLEDGTLLRIGDRLVDLHFWNEQVPIMPAGRPTLAFARRVESCVDISLSELGRYLSTHDNLADVKAIRGNMSLGPSARAGQIARIAAKYGFENVARRQRLSFAKRLHMLGENILITLLVMGRNPRAIRRDTLRRDRTLTFLSRRSLEKRYGC